MHLVVHDIAIKMNSMKDLFCLVICNITNKLKV